MIGREAWHGFDARRLPPVNARWDRFTDVSTNGSTPAVRVALVGSDVAWGAVKWFSYAGICAHVLEECAERGLRCTVANVTRSSLCSTKLLFLSQAHIVVAVGGELLMRNSVFARPGAAVIEVVPPGNGSRTEEQRGVRRDMAALGLRYEQVTTTPATWHAGLLLLLWLGRIALRQVSSN